LENCGQRKIQVIKDLRTAYGFNLVTAKSWADKAPCILPATPPGVAGKLIKDLRDSGATVSVVDPSVLDQMAAVSFIQSAAASLGEGDLAETRTALRAALALVGDV